jgi:hypothetical protein
MEILPINAGSHHRGRQTQRQTLTPPLPARPGETPTNQNQNRHRAMTTPQSVMDDLFTATDLLQLNPSATWHLSAANMLEDIAKRIREEVAKEKEEK